MVLARSLEAPPGLGTVRAGSSDSSTSGRGTVDSRGALTNVMARGRTGSRSAVEVDPRRGDAETCVDWLLVLLLGNISAAASSPRWFEGILPVEEAR